MAKFPSNFSLWQILRQFESGTASAGKNLNFTARGVAQTVNGTASGSGQLYYETPVLTVMGRVFDKISDFKKDLSQLGFNSGNVLIRLDYRKTDRTFHDAMVEISQLFGDEEKEQTQTQTEAKTGLQPPAAQSSATPQESESPDIESEATEATTPGIAEPTPTPADQFKAATPKAVDIDVVSSHLKPSATPPAASDSLQPMSVFAAPSGNVPAAALLSSAVPDHEYTPTVAHAHLRQAHLQESARNQRLLSDRELEARAAAASAREAAISSVTVKVRFPDTTSAQWQFGRDATGATIYAAVRSVMRDPTQPFRIVLSAAAKGPLTIRDEGNADGTSQTGNNNNRLIQGYKFRGAVLLNLVWDDAVPAEVRRLPFLRQDVARQAQQVVVPDVPAGHDEDEPSERKVVKAPPKEEKGEGSGEKKLPKWLKLPGKK